MRQKDIEPSLACQILTIDIHLRTSTSQPHSEFIIHHSSFMWASGGASVLATVRAEKAKARLQVALNPIHHSEFIIYNSIVKFGNLPLNQRL